MTKTNDGRFEVTGDAVVSPTPVPVAKEDTPKKEKETDNNTK